MKWLIELIRKWFKKPDPKPEPDLYPDEIHPADINWQGVNVGAWKKIASLGVSLDGGGIIYDQEATSHWPSKRFGNNPDGTPKYLVGNAWIFIKRNGEWVGVTHEWMRPGQKRKGKASVAWDHIKHHWFPEPWTPTVGEQYGACISGLCRDATRNVNERTNIKLCTWR
jgi:hypothetical protein